MDIRQITDSYFVAPQIDPSDIPEIAAAGITTIICNRPDSEVPPSHQAAAVHAAASAAGIEFHELPLTHQTMTPDTIGTHRDIVESAPGATLAYCASGTRSTIAWALGQAGSLPTDDIVSSASAGGYDLENMRPTLEAIAAQSR